VLFLLAFCLHPHYMRAARALLAQDRRAAPMSFLSAPCLANASAGYSAKWFPSERERSNAIVQQTFDFLTGDIGTLLCPAANGRPVVPRCWVDVAEILGIPLPGWYLC